MASKQITFPLEDRPLEIQSFGFNLKDQPDVSKLQIDIFPVPQEKLHEIYLGLVPLINKVLQDKGVIGENFMVEELGHGKPN